MICQTKTNAPAFWRSGLIWVALTALLALGACDHGIDDDDPLTPEEVLQELLPLTQRNMAFWKTADMIRFPAIWTQQLAGIRGKEQQIDVYEADPLHTNNMWSNYYEFVNLYLENTIFYAEQVNAKAYRGIARIMQAKALGMMTDTFGHIPFFEAEKYLSGFERPAYDEQEELILHLINMLESATNDLRDAMEGEGMLPGGSEDLIYGGALHKWIRAANMIRLRYLIRLSHHQEDYTRILQEAEGDELFSGNADNMLYTFPDPVGSENPFYHYDQNVRNTRAGKFFVDMLTQTGDPRLPRLIRRNTDNQYVGSAPGEGLHEASYPGLAVAGRQAPIAFVIYPELKFIQAEAYWRYGQFAQADQAFAEGVKASLAYFGVSDPGWEATHAQVENVSLRQIIEAKYIALFLQHEVWSDFRRTGYPELPPYGEADGMIPRRQLYPQDELDFNEQNVPQDETIFDRIWWDILVDEF